MKDILTPGINIDNGYISNDSTRAQNSFVFLIEINVYYNILLASFHERLVY